LHRDLKPENLYVVAERKGFAGGIKLIDFGLATADRARVAESDPSLVSVTSGGTPLYMAPELWRGEEASPRTDLFALGLTFYEALSGRLPFEAHTTRDVMKAMSAPAEFPAPNEGRPDVSGALASVVAKLVRKRPEDRYATADELVAALVAAGAASRPRRVPGSGPYRGLASFSPAERDVFFGRDVETAEVLERLRAQAGVILAGPSGSGKSSLALAGVVPAVEEGALGGGVVYAAVVLTPRVHPVASLAAALSRAMGTPEKELAAFLRSTPRRLGESLREALPASSGVVVVVDQLEEIATLARDPGEAADFAAALASLAEVSSPGLRLVATVRADLMDRLFAQEALRPVLTRGFYPVRPLVGEALRRAIEEPARAAGFSVEDPRVVGQIVAEAGETSAGLPLVSFAMAAWWAKRDETRHVLPTAAWTALGGLGGALASHGDGVLLAMDVRERAAAEQILVRLVTADGTRARAPRSSLIDPAAVGPGAPRALDRLIEAKLVVETSGDIELVHEALIRSWPRLASLLVSSGEDRAFRERITAAAREWDAQGRPPGALWTGEQGARLVRWLSTSTSPLGQLELAFVEEVRRHASRRQLVLRSVVVATVLVAVGLGLAAKTSERQMAAELAKETKRANEAQAAFRRAEAGRLRAVAEARVETDPQGAMKSALESLELSPDASLDALAWRARATGIPHALPLHVGGTTYVRFSPAGTRIATAGKDGNVHVLATSSLEHALLHPSHDRAGEPRSLSFAPDGDRLVIGTSMGELVLAAAPAFTPSTAAKCEGSVEGVAWSGATVFARCVRTADDATLVALDVAARQTREIVKGDVSLWYVAVETGRVVYLRRNGTGAIVIGASSVELSLPKELTATAVALSPDGKQLAIGGSDGRVWTFPIDDKGVGKPRVFTEHHAGPVSVLRFDPGGTRLLSIGHDRAARVFEDGRDRLASFEVGGVAHAFVGKRGAIALVARSGDVALVSLRDGQVIGRLTGATGDVTSLDADTAGRFVIAASRDGGARAYPFVEAAALVTRAPERPVPACGLAVDGAAIACAAPGAKEVRVTEMEGGTGAHPPRTLAVSGAITGVAASAKGDHVATWSSEGLAIDGQPASPAVTPHLATWSTEGALAVGEGRAVSVWRGGAQTSRAALSADPTAIAFARGGTVWVGLANGEVVPVTGTSVGAPLGLPKAEGAIRAIAVNDDASSVAVGSTTGRVVVARPGGSEGTVVARLHASIGCLAWSVGGRALVAGADRRLVVLDDTGQIALHVGTSPTPVQGCVRSTIDDRFSFVAEGGAAWIRLLDLAPIAGARVPDGALDPKTAQASQWRGLPESSFR
jgi:hypothetical protein